MLFHAQGSCRRLVRLAGTLLLLGAGLSATAAESTLTLERAWALAEAANPELRAAEASIAAAEGALADTRGLLWNNPEITAERLRRKMPQPDGELRREWRTDVSQTLEIAGQQGFRRSAAEQSLSALKEGVRDTRRQVRAGVERRFVQVLGLQARVATEGELVDLIRDMAGAARKRFEGGEDTRLDSNLAEVELERAGNQLEAAREALIRARAELAATLQLPAESLPQAEGTLSAEVAIPYTLEDLLAAAAGRPRLRALEHQEQAARSRLRLERGAAYPDVTVGLFASREGPGDGRGRLSGFTVALPLPLFRRNATGIGQASTALAQTQIERRAATRDIRAAVIAGWQRLESLRGRVKRLQAFALERLRENQRLSTAAYRAGEISLPELLLASRQLLDTRREVLDAMTELALTRVELEQVAGWSPQP